MPNQTALDSSTHAALWTTALVGVLVAWASAIPLTARGPALLLGLLAWTMAIAFFVVCAVRAAWPRPMAWSDRGATVLGAAGIGIAVLGAAQLEIIRLVSGRPGMVWNVDWRFAWNHAQAIARFGDVDHALDYSGAPVEYHVGPSWLGGMTDRVLGGGMTEVLFGLVPVLCIVSAATALIRLLGRAGVPLRLAAAAVGVAFCLPLGFVMNGFPETLRELLRDADTWFFASGLMLNSFLGVAVGFCSLALLLDRRQRWEGIVLGAAGLASLVQIKPQFFVGLGAVIGLVGVGRVLGAKPFDPQSRTVLWAGLCALALALLAKSMLPGQPITFMAPVWAPGSTGFSPMNAPVELLIVPALLAILAVAAWSLRSSVAVMQRVGRLGELLAALVVAIGLLAAAFMLVTFPLLPQEIVMRARGVRDPDAAVGAQQDLAQALIPLHLLLRVGGLAALAVLVRGAMMSARILPLALAAGLIVISPLPLIGRNFVQPLRAYEAAEDTALLTLLQQVPRNNELLISSDLADPAEYNYRHLRGVLLTAYGGRAFYVANLAYVHYRWPDSLQRLEDLRVFFGSPWSGWHDGWLLRTHITHVLVDDRCLPRWWGQPDIPVKTVARSGPWTLLEPQGLTAGDSVPPPAWEIMKPRYGRGACL